MVFTIELGSPPRREHACIFCSSYGDDTHLYVFPLDHQDSWKYLAKKVIESGAREVEIQARFEALDPLEAPRIRDVIIYFLQHDVKVKLFTNLLWDLDHVQRFVMQIIDAVGPSVIYEEKFQIHTSLHGADPVVLSEIWQCSLREAWYLLGLLLRNIAWLTGAGFYVGIHFVVTRINYHEVFRVYWLALVLGARMVSFLRLVPHGLAVSNWLKIAMTWENWIDFYQKVLRLLRLVTGVMIGDSTRLGDIMIALRKIGELLTLLSIRFPADSRLVDITNIDDYPVPRFGCPINWFFKIEHMLREVGDDDVLRLMYRWRILPPPRCSAILGTSAAIDSGGYYPCVAFKHIVRCRDLQELRRYRESLFRKWMPVLREYCHRCRYWTLCVGKCWAQKALMSWDRDELCRLFDKYGAEIVLRSFNEHLRGEVEKILLRR